MNRSFIAGAVAAFAVAAGSGAALAQGTASPSGAAASASSTGAPPARSDSSGPAGSRKLQGPVVSVQTVSMTGKVTAIDPAKRQLTVKDEKGHVATVVAGQDVRNFDNLKLGDEVRMRYTEAESLAIAKGGPGNDAKMGEIRTRIESRSSSQAPAGGKPAVNAMEQTVVVANVFKIDRQHGTVTLRGTGGDPVEVKVPDKQALQQLKPNDQVVIGYRQAMAVAIEPGSAGRTASAGSGSPSGTAGSGTSGAAGSGASGTAGSGTSGTAGSGTR